MTLPMTIDVPGAGTVSGLLDDPPDATCVLALAHGAGAGMRHQFMHEIAAALARRGVAVLRYQFPYAEAELRRIDSAPVLLATVRSAVAAAARVADGRTLVAGGKSMGGRMTSLAASEAPLVGVRGLAFLGFPLHPARRPSTGRASHLAGAGEKVDSPMLFVQGSRDDLGGIDLLEPIVAGLSRATLQVIEGADHGFHVLKRSGRTDAEVIEQVAQITRDWIAALD